MDIRQLNTDLLRALGLKDIDNVRKATLTVEAGHLPPVVVEHILARESDKAVPVQLRHVLEPAGREFVDATVMHEGVRRMERRP